MKKKIWALGLVWLLLLGAAALADGGDWHESRNYGSVQLANYAGWCDGYQSVDGFGGITAADSFTLTVISKSASIWSEPSTGSKKLGSVSYGESLTGVSSDGGNNVAMDRNFYEVEYNGRQGWVGATYVVRNTLEIVLMESNVPAYIAPDARSKKVGSLSKMTATALSGSTTTITLCPSAARPARIFPRMPRTTIRNSSACTDRRLRTAAVWNTARSSAPARMTVIPKSRR